MKKFRIKGKTYTLIEELVSPEDFVKYIAKVKNSKGEFFTLVHSFKTYTLYNDKQHKVLSTYSIKEIG